MKKKVPALQKQKVLGKKERRKRFGFGSLILLVSGTALVGAAWGMIRLIEGAGSLLDELHAAQFSAGGQAELHLSYEKAPLPPEQESEIRAKLLAETGATRLAELDEAALRHIAQKVHLSEPFIDRIQLVHDGRGGLFAKIRAREPAMKVQADRLRFLSADGIIFGEAGAQPLQTLQLARNPSGKLDVGRYDGNRLLTDKETANKLRQAVELLEATRNAGLVLTLIELEPFRGLKVVLQSGESVLVGWHPFPKKLKKLKFILAAYAKRGERIAKVELDFEGKAFVKKLDIPAVEKALYGGDEKNKAASDRSARNLKATRKNQDAKPVVR